MLIDTLCTILPGELERVFGGWKLVSKSGSLSKSLGETAEGNYCRKRWKVGQERSVCSRCWQEQKVQAVFFK